MRDFRELKVWEKAHRLTLQIYRITKNFPSDERFGLTVRELNQQVNEVKKILNSFIQKLTANG
ncbi:MAG: four helix bundle protein [Proteobacteria bacterium]|nr:four helix bundle protein [Pseudomonadota bacterium]MBU4462441.1 four helix bundle protein [Pseudomonadota bacterium]NQT10305.1 four helix bundle protein [Desulfobacteraceae bacterium]